MPNRRDKVTGSLFKASASAAPLAARMRPTSLDEFVGQAAILGPGKPLREAIERGTVGSLILWGPPGSGKTTLGHLVAQFTDREFVPFSAVTEGVPRVREIIAEAARRLEMGRGTILFVDEIHRFNRAQQDAFLAAVESGTVTLIGATTENPSFELNGALLSRARVVVLEPLSPDDIIVVLRRALTDGERGLGAWSLAASDEAFRWLAVESDGDARRALNVLEAAAEHTGRGATLTVEVLRDALQRRVARYDKSGEEHYNLISAYHKALRGATAGRIVLAGAHDRWRRGPDVYRAPVHPVCVGRRRTRGSTGTAGRAGGAGRVSYAWLARRGARPCRSGRVSGDGAEEQSGVRGLGRCTRRGPGVSR
jgi:putative ATPase